MNLLDLLIKIGVDDKASEKIHSISEKAKGGFAGIAKAAGIVSGAVSAVAGSAVFAIGKSAFDSYAQYEQLVGGVDKLFGQSSEKLQQYAQNAYKTSGLSANQYMEQATSFSASLIQSLGGDTEKAAEQTEVAMRAISDNVNVFGSDMGSVQAAFQGFAKQNYMMLDNLKLGYGGTKTEMERLISDAKEYASQMSSMSFDEFSNAMKDTGLSASALREQYERLTNSTELSIDSYSDVITAIEIIQEKQNIAGTTAKEAMKTIEGSVNMTKAAWMNFLTELGKDDADIGARIDELVESGLAAIDNIAPRVVTIVDRVLDAIPLIVDKAGPEVEKLMDRMSAFIEEHEEEIKAAADFVFSGIAYALGQVMLASLANFGAMMGKLIETFPEWAPQLLEAAVMLFVNILQGIINATVEILNGMANLIGQLLKYVIDAAAPMMENAKQMMKGLINGIIQSAQGIWDAITSILNGAKQQIDEAILAIQTAFDNFFKALENVWNNVRATIGSVVSNISSAFNSIREGAGSAISAISNFVQNAVNKVGELPGRVRSALGNLGGYLYSSGKALLDGFINGIADRFSAAKGMVSEGLAGLRKLFPFSPAKEGPFSGKGWVLYSGMSIMDALAEGAKSKESSTVRAFSGIAQEVSDALDPGDIEYDYSANGSIGGGNIRSNGKYAGNATSIYIDGAVFNSDERINELFGLLMLEMQRKGMMNASSAAQIDGGYANGYY